MDLEPADFEQGRAWSSSGRALSSLDSIVDWIDRKCGNNHDTIYMRATHRILLSVVLPLLDFDVNAPAAVPGDPAEVANHFVANQAGVDRLDVTLETRLSACITAERSACLALQSPSVSCRSNWCDQMIITEVELSAVLYFPPY